MRRNDIDRLRILGILLLFPFHTARVFDHFEPNYIQNSTLSWGASWFIAAVAPWFMPLLFLLSGYSAFHALKRRSNHQFVRERVGRLLVPFVLGLLIIVPPQGYFARLQQGSLSGGYLAFLGQFFSNFSDLSGYQGSFTPAHLWFILYLFVISLAFLPLLQSRQLQAPPENGALSRLLRTRWGLLSVFLVLTVSEAAPAPGGKNPFYFALFYLIGYLIARDKLLEQTISRVKSTTAALIVIAGLPYFVFLLDTVGADDFSAISIAFAFLRNFWVWCVLISLLGYAAKYWQGDSRLLPWLNQAAFPVYVVHQTVLVALAFFIVQWPLNILPKFMAIMLGSLAGSVCLFELARRSQLPSLILGIKHSARSTGAEPIRSKGA